MPAKPYFIEKLHTRFIIHRRIDRLVRYICPLLPEKAVVLDVGCGDGRLSRAIMDWRSDVTIWGIEVSSRDQAYLDMVLFEGRCIPFADNSFDAVLLIDVLHHSHDITGLFRECVRVARRTVMVKDHVRQGFLAGPTLSFMDRVGNARFGVSVDCTYLTRNEWSALFAQSGMDVQRWVPRLGLYPWPLSLVFDRRMHFVAALQPEK